LAAGVRAEVEGHKGFAEEPYAKRLEERVSDLSIDTVPEEASPSQPRPATHVALVRGTACPDQRLEAKVRQNVVVDYFASQ
jgi:hypothetical protein